MLTYKKRLAEFAHGKRLLRLPRPVRDRADAFCDACGSSQPRTLYTLKDLGSEGYYFVGDTCLTKLAKSGAVLRRYGRESGQKAMNLRWSCAPKNWQKPLQGQRIRSHRPPWYAAWSLAKNGGAAPTSDA